MQSCEEIGYDYSLTVHILRMASMLECIVQYEFTESGALDIM